MCVHKNWPYERLNTESSGGIAPASLQEPPPSFDIQRIGNSVFIDVVGSPSHVKELDYWFGEEWRGWDRRVQYLEEGVIRIRYKGEEEEGIHKDGLKIDPRCDVVINSVEGVE